MCLTLNDKRWHNKYGGDTSRVSHNASFCNPQAYVVNDGMKEFDRVFLGYSIWKMSSEKYKSGVSYPWKNIAVRHLQVIVLYLCWRHSVIVYLSIHDIGDLLNKQVLAITLNHLPTYRNFWL